MGLGIATAVAIAILSFRAGIVYREAGFPVKEGITGPFWITVLGFSVLVLSAFALAVTGGLCFWVFQRVRWLAGLIGGPTTVSVEDQKTRARLP